MTFIIGKWVPTIARKIDEENPSAPVPINLKGIGIGDGLMSPQDSAIYGDQLYQGKWEMEIFWRKCSNYIDPVLLDGIDWWNH